PGGTPDSAPYIVVERIDYSNLAPWPVNADGSGQSLQRLSLTGYANDPTNWVAAAPTPGPASPPNDDSDGDGLPDAWETAHGFDPFDPADAGGDADNDGLTNLQEYLSGTDPRDPQSYLKINSVSASGGSIVIRFIAV